MRCIQIGIIPMWTYQLPKTKTMESISFLLMTCFSAARTLHPPWVRRLLAHQWHSSILQKFRQQTLIIVKDHYTTYGSHVKFTMKLEQKIDLVPRCESNALLFCWLQPNAMQKTITDWSSCHNNYATKRKKERTL